MKIKTLISIFMILTILISLVSCNNDLSGNDIPNNNISTNDDKFDTDNNSSNIDISDNISDDIFDDIFNNISNDTESSTTIANDIIICDKCGADNNATNRFCVNCDNEFIVRCAFCFYPNALSNKTCEACNDALNIECISCSHTNSLLNKFCGSCGTKLIVTCSFCNEENWITNNSCAKCGTNLETNSDKNNSNNTVEETTKIQPVEKPDPNAGVKLQSSSLTLFVGDVKKLQVSYIPTYKNGSIELTYESTFSDVAEIDKDGNIYAKKEGLTVITVKSKENPSHYATCILTVSNKTNANPGITLNTASLSLEIGKNSKIIATYVPKYNGSSTTLYYSSSDSTVATVDASGNVSAKKKGTAIITVKNNDNTYSATCTVTVTPKKNANAGITLSTTNLSLEIGGNSGRIPVSYVPAYEGDTTKLYWSLSDTSIIDVSNDGNVLILTPKKQGTTTLTVKTEDNVYSASCTVTVTPKKNANAGITLSTTNLSIEMGKSGRIPVSYVPAYEGDTTKLYWSLSDTSIIDVSNDGNVLILTPKKYGTTTLTVKTTDNVYSASCTVTVTEVSEIWLLVKQNTYQPRGLFTGNMVYTSYYDANGFLTKKESAWTNGNVFERYQYFNDSLGNIVQLEFNNYSNYQSSSIKYTLKYNAKGQLIEQKKDDWNTFKYSYDESGNLSEETYEYYDKLGELSLGNKTVYKNGKKQCNYVYNYNTGWILFKEWFYDSNGFLSSSKQYWNTPNYKYYDEGKLEGTVGNYTYHTVTYTATYVCDSHGNVIKETIPSPYGTETYQNEYMLLSEYCKKGLCFTPSINTNEGTAKCSVCKAEGHSRCQGHTCTVCSGVGDQRCNGCYGLGKKLGKTCPVCYGMGTQICPNCEGARKLFYD